MTTWHATQHPGYLVTTDGRVRGPSGRVLKQKLVKGYPCVGISDRWTYVHTIMCTTFLGPRPTPTHQVAHGNGVRHDNRLTNLRWATPAENSADAVRHGTSPLRPGGAGERNGHARLTWDQVRQIRASARGGASTRQLAGEYGIGKSQVHNIVSGKQWREERAA